MNQLSIINYFTLYVILQQLETAAHDNQGSDKCKPWNPGTYTTVRTGRKLPGHQSMSVHYQTLKVRYGQNYK